MRLGKGLASADKKVATHLLSPEAAAIATSSPPLGLLYFEAGAFGAGFARSPPKDGDQRTTTRVPTLTRS